MWNQKITEEHRKKLLLAKNAFSKHMTKIKFEVSPEELSSLHELNDKTNPEKLEKMGGAEGLAEILQTDLQMGTRKTEKERKYRDRKKHFGVNRFKEPEFKGFWPLFKDTFDDPTLKILIVSAIVSLVLGVTVEDPKTGWIEGTAILMAVLIVSFVTAINDYQKEKQFRELNKVKDNITCTVVREKQEEEFEGEGEKLAISIHDIVTGDIVVLETGSKVPADGILFYASELKANESVMTGEIKEINKTPEEDCWMISGTEITQGEGKFIVTSVGKHSQWGKIMEKAKSKEEVNTPLQDKLEKMADQIGKLGLWSAVLTVAVLLAKWGFRLYTKLNEGEEFVFHDLVEVVDAVIVGITIVVVAVPEGLPLAVTISLAYSMKKMMEDNNLVRKLESCETMGNATCICSDKTGTLTKNEMTVVAGYFFGEKYEEVPECEQFDEKYLDIFVRSIALNSKAYFHFDEEKQKDVVMGSKTEGALLLMLKQWKQPFNKIREEQENLIAKSIPFSSKRKRMTTIINHKDGYLVFCKGASEIILDKCVMHVNGENLDSLDEERINKLKNVIEGMASNGLRTLCLAYRYVDKNNFDNFLEEDPEKEIETQLTLLSIVGIKDPVRDAVPQAVEDSKSAGVTVRMVTGDNIVTAKHIAKECGIYTEGGLVMEGFDFRHMTNEERLKIIPNLQVLARSSPKDKLTLVKHLKEMGEVVGVTGDGTNDAPALKEANVGLSMGIAGTDVAKEASDIVILDDNFKSIVIAIMWGRSVYDNIRKFLQFQLTVNVVALSTSFLAAVSGVGLPLKAVQLLWVNLIMDTLAALALGTEPPTKDLLKRRPYKKDASLLNGIMKRNIGAQSVYQLLVLLGILKFGGAFFGLDPLVAEEKLHLDCIVFNTFVLMQVFNEINCRKINDEANIFKGIFNNMIFIGIWVGIIIIQAIVIEFGGSFFSTTHLNTFEWGVSTFLGLLSIPLGFVFRLIPAKGDPQ
ncbi:calcium-transporting atpase [Anaeramoeba flamelloides]|uniref:Calcium-transporting ATPase n=1 Tax=Anaeramoeba flamelloides TaxID=1746091 RepID=A0ABQ8YNU6_9EUKA|nr:calcium-transporting atpase [Anaeramoeba flamelloides]